MLPDVLAERLYDGLIKLLSLPTSLGVVSSGEAVNDVRHGTDGLKKLGDKLLSVIGELIRRGAVSVHWMF